MTKERPNLSEYFSFDFCSNLMQIVENKEKPLYLWASIRSVVPLQQKAAGWSVAYVYIM
jgi:hypothetical protein